MADSLRQMDPFSDEAHKTINAIAYHIYLADKSAKRMHRIPQNSNLLVTFTRYHEPEMNIQITVIRKDFNQSDFTFVLESYSIYLYRLLRFVNITIRTWRAFYVIKRNS